MNTYSHSQILHYILLWCLKSSLYVWIQQWTSNETAEGINHFSDHESYHWEMKGIYIHAHTYNCNHEVNHLPVIWCKSFGWGCQESFHHHIHLSEQSGQKNIRDLDLLHSVGTDQNKQWQLPVLPRYSEIHDTELWIWHYYEFIIDNKHFSSYDKSKCNSQCVTALFVHHALFYKVHWTLMVNNNWKYTTITNWCSLHYNFSLLIPSV